MTNPCKITPQELRELEAQGACRLVDVRTPAEFDSLHASGAVNIPLDRLGASAIQQHFPECEGPLYVICQSGARSRRAAELLAAEGMDNVVDVLGGTNAWNSAGLPVVCGRESLPLEAQVRIVAGALVLVGVITGLLVHPAALVIAGGVGAGLLIAGIRNSCPMATLIARMPWNQRGARR